MGFFGLDNQHVNRCSHLFTFKGHSRYFTFKGREPLFHLFTLSPFHSFPFSPLKGVSPFFHLFTLSPLKGASHFSTLSPFHLLRAQPFFSPFHLFTFKRCSHFFTFSPFPPFTFTAMYWKNKKRISVTKMRLLVGILGLEPRMTGPESVVLPLHHIPILVFALQSYYFFRICQTIY